MTTLRDGDLLQVVNSPQGYTIPYADLRAQILDDPTTGDVSAIQGGLGCIEQTVAVASMTAGGGTTGTFDLAETVPVGSRLLNCSLYVSGAFTGDVSATIQVGDGTDVDRFSTGTPSVFTTGHKDMGAVSGTAYVATAITPRITITSATSFDLVSAAGSGILTVRLNYLQPASTS